jgi:hypothetical protein
VFWRYPNDGEIKLCLSFIKYRTVVTLLHASSKLGVIWIRPTASTPTALRPGSESLILNGKSCAHSSNAVFLLSVSIPKEEPGELSRYSDQARDGRPWSVNTGYGAHLTLPEAFLQTYGGRTVKLTNLHIMVRAVPPLFRMPFWRAQGQLFMFSCNFWRQLKCFSVWALPLAVDFQLSFHFQIALSHLAPHNVSNLQNIIKWR